MKCRLCKNKLYLKPILILKGMPKAAQFFPKKNEFKNDKPITLNIFQCKKCGLVQLNNRPVSYFKEVITAATLSLDARKSRLKLISNFINQNKLVNKKAIEIGCARGDVLEIINEAGMKSYGLEYSSNSVSHGKSLGRNITKSFIGDSKKIKNGPFQAFFCFNFFEHMPDPQLFIKTVYNNLSDKGVGLITVPNLDYLIKTKSFYEFVADHLSYFTTDTLKFAFESNKFNVLECFLINNDNDILIKVQKNPNKKIKKVKKIKKINIYNKFQSVKILINKLKFIIKKYKKNNKKIAIWGAGHRTLALLALSKAHQVDLIIDSAKFKQGRYSPILHTKILGPEELIKSKIDLLMIMLPGIYPDEVIKSVKKLNLNIDLAKLKDNRISFI